MSQSASAFAATEAINEGLWDDHLGSLLLAVRHRLALISPNHKPEWPPPEGCVWVWLDGEGGPQWRPKGLGVIIETIYLARCATCDMDVPFASEEARAEWVEAHGSAPHPFAGGALPVITTREETRT